MTHISPEEQVELSEDYLEEDSVFEVEHNIQLEEVDTVLKITDLCQLGDKKTLYNARHARKGRMDNNKELSALSVKWISKPQPNNISWWIAVLWTVGSVFHVTRGIFNFLPLFTPYGSYISAVGALFWLIAGFMSYFEVINTVNNVNERIQITKLCVFRPNQVDWWIGISTFIGTISIQIPFFSISFFDFSEFSHGSWILYYFCPILVGCLCFIVSSLLQLAEGSGKARFFTWNPLEPWYWSVWMFFMGSVIWMIMCILWLCKVDSSVVASSLYLSGSILYFIGSYALIVEVQN